MINSLCGSIGSSKSTTEASSCTKLNPPNDHDQSVSAKTSTPILSSSSSDFEQTSCLNFPAPKFEIIDGDNNNIENIIESPDVNSDVWDSLFADQLDCDFMMISSPARRLSSPQGGSSLNYYNYMNNNYGEAIMQCSPPRSPSSQFVGANANANNVHHKGKGLSPLHKVFNSPSNHLYMQAIEGIEGSSSRISSLPTTIGELLEEGFDLQTYDDVDDQNLPKNINSGINGDQSLQYNYDISTSCLEREFYNDPIQEHGKLSESQEQQEEDSDDSGLELVHLLLACAEAVAKEDYMLARRYLQDLNRVVSPIGDSMQRVASCFTEALSARLAATLTVTSTAAKPSSNIITPPQIKNSLEVLKIYQIVYQACPYVKFAHFTANQAIFEAFQGEDRVHVIDLDILQGYQWPAFMQALAARPGCSASSPPPFLRITGVGPAIDAVRETGRCLAELAHSLNVPFEFHAIGEQLEALRPNMFNRRVGEALAVNAVNRLHRVSGRSLGNLLGMIRDQAPNIVTLVEQEASHNGPYFLGRFLEALHYYSAIFDSLDATFPADSGQRAKVEQYIFAPEIRNIVACEGGERIERHERLEKWRKLMEAKGFKGVGLSGNAVTQSKILLGLYSSHGYRLTQDNGCLLLGWQDRPLIAASAWRC